MQVGFTLLRPMSGRISYEYIPALRRVVGPLSMAASLSHGPSRHPVVFEIQNTSLFR